MSSIDGHESGTMRFATILGLFFSTLSFVTVFAQDDIYLDSKQSLGLVRSVYVHINDEVKDNCWTNVGFIKSKIRLTFEQNNIPVYMKPLWNYTPFNPMIYIDALGHRIGNSEICTSLLIITVAVNIVKIIDGNFTNNKRFYISNNGFLLSSRAIINGLEKLDIRFLEFIESSINNIVADIISMRRDEHVKMMLKEWPDEGINPMSKEEFRRMASDALKKETNE